MSILKQKMAQSQAAADRNADAAAKSLLSEVRRTNARGEIVTLPVLGKAWIQLPGEEQTARIEAQVTAEMAALNMPPIGLHGDAYGSRRDRLTLAFSVRDPDNHDVRFGSDEDWAEIDIDLIAACSLVFHDVRERLDPIGMSSLTVETFDEVSRAIEKKSPNLLKRFGVSTLALYLLTSAARQSISPTPTSSTGPSSPESGPLEPSS